MAGTIARISGPTVIARDLAEARMYDLVRVGELRLIGEIIRLEGSRATVQVYEETGGLGIAEAVEDLGRPLTAELGPGLLGSLYDGVQRPLDLIQKESGNFLRRGAVAPALPRRRKWEFTPRVAAGAEVEPGELLGVVQENEVIEHRLLAPPGTRGRIAQAREGAFTVEEPVIILEDGRALSLLQRWPVRVPRPSRRKLDPETLFLTGQRVLDTFFPLAEGGNAIVPGGFGTGKTVLQHTLAKYAAADIIVYIGCGERGNEMTEVLTDFPDLKDPDTGLPLIARTVLIANTSNMPVAAREASLYTGITIAEYYRDQGYRVALMADSTSRWAEALREISSRQEELPGEEGYPTYLATRLANFYERSGRVLCLGGDTREGSITMICAISPPGGDFSEPVTQASLRVAGTFWALDPSLAHRRHFPAVSPRLSYSLYRDRLRGYFSTAVNSKWPENVTRATALLQKEEELQEVVQLVGIDAVPDRERLVLESGRMIREGFLGQSAYHPVDVFSSLRKQFGLLECILLLFERLGRALEGGVPLQQLLDLSLREEVARLKELPDEHFEEAVRELRRRVENALDRAAPHEDGESPGQGEKR